MRYKESEAETKFRDIDPLLRDRGYEKFVRLEEKMDEGQGRSDYSIHHSSKEEMVVACIEAKSSNRALTDKDREQALNYGRDKSAKIVFCTNGSFWEALYVPKAQRFKVNGQEVDYLPPYENLLRWVEEEKNGEYISPLVESGNKMSFKNAIKKIDNILNNEGKRPALRVMPTATLLAITLLEQDGLLKDRGINEEITLKDIVGQKDPKRAAQLFRDTLWRLLVQGFPSIFDPARTSCSTVLSLSDQAIYDILSVLQDTDFGDRDLIGDVYEYFLNWTATKNDQGQYFTPREICKLITHIMDYKVGDKICDPFAGTCGFLTCAFKDLMTKVNKNDAEQKRFLKIEALQGVEKEKDTATLGAVNLFIVGDGSSNLEVNDTFNTYSGALEGDQYDKIATNIPFIGDPVREEGASGRKNLLSIESLDRYPIRSNNAEILAIQRVLMLLKEGGRAAIIIPSSATSKRDKEFVALRRYLVENTTIHAVIELPQYAFGYTPASATIIVLDKVKVSQQRTLFIRLRHLGYTLDVNRESIDQNDLPEAYSLWNTFFKKEEVTSDIAFDREYIGSNLGADYSLGVKEVQESIEGLTTLESLIRQGSVLFINASNFKKSKRINESVKIIKTRYICWSRHLRGRDLCHIEWISKHTKTKEKGTEKNSYYKGQLLQEGDIVFCHSGQGTIGKVGIVEENPPYKCVVENLIWHIRVDPEVVDPYYLYIVLGTIFKGKEGMSKTLATARVTEKWGIKEFCAVSFPLPSIEEQRELVKSLKEAMTIELENSKNIDQALENITL